MGHVQDTHTYSSMPQSIYINLDPLFFYQNLDPLLSSCFSTVKKDNSGRKERMERGIGRDREDKERLERVSTGEDPSPVI